MTVGFIAHVHSRSRTAQVIGLMANMLLLHSFTPPRRSRCNPWPDRDELAAWDDDGGAVDREAAPGGGLSRQQRRWMERQARKVGR